MKVPPRLNPKKKPHTIPDIFILESVELKDEAKRRNDGWLLAEALRLFKKRPIYYYFRTERELEELAAEFTSSRYRYLHVSCHGSATTIETTFDSITYQRFARIFAKRLNNRRLFVSACEVGNELFGLSMKGSSPGLYSVLRRSL